MSKCQFSSSPAGLRVAVFLVLAALTAVCPEAALGDYLVDTWRFDDDLPRDGINSIAQGSDGYLWVSSRYGLARFDGVRFVNFTAQSGAQFVGNHYAEFRSDASRNVWIGTPGAGLMVRTANRLQPCLQPRTPEAGPVYGALTNAQGRHLAMTPDGQVLGWSNGMPERVVDAGRWGGVVPASLCQDKAANIWFVTYEHKLVRVVGSNAQEMSFGVGEERRNWIALAAGDGDELCAGTQLGIGIWHGDRFELLASPVESQLPVDDVIAVRSPARGGARTPQGAATESNRLWVIGLGRAWLLDGTRWITNVLFEPSAGLYETSPRITDREGNLWFTTTKAGVVRAGTDGSLTVLTSGQGLPPGRVSALFEDLEGSIWVGIEHAGLARLRERYFTMVGTREGIKAPLVWAVIEDSAGAIWLGTENGGLQRWQEGKLTQFDLGNNVVASSVYSLCLDRHGQVWAGTGDARVFRFDNGKFVLVWEDASPGWNKRVYGIYEDRAGQMWFASGMGLFCWKEGNVRRLSGKGFESSVVRVVCEDATGRMWVGRSGGSEIRLACVEGDDLVARGVEAGLKGHDVFGLHADEDGSLWIGTVGDGLWRHRNGSFTRYTTEDGLPDDRIYSIAPDGAGNFWLSTPAGIIRLARESVVEFDTERAAPLDCLLFNRTDGLPTRECSGGTGPVIFRARDGRLLFALTEGAVALSPARIKVNPVPPQVIIEEVRVDGKPTSTDGALQLGPGRRMVEFRFTANSLVAPSKVRFTYRLDEVDSGWRDADVSRSAMYSLTSPGEYRFHVKACNNDGVWNETGASVSLRVSPFFWQTWTFRIAGSLGILVGLAGTIVVVERRKLRRRVEQFEMQQLVEKERARIARDIHDELGASLTEIGLLSEFAQRDTAAGEQVKSDVRKIASEAQSCTRALDEIVWAVNPRNDTLDGFVTYACAYAEEHLRLADIRCRLDAGSPLPRRPLRPDLRHHLFLAFKEALNNVIKHADASEVEVRFSVQKDRLLVSITDNGCGFDPAAGSTRNGLRNMKQRLESIGGAFDCESAPGRGTRINLAMRLD